MKRRRVQYPVPIALSLALFLIGSPVTLEAAEPDAGERIYRNTCQVCHGEKGDARTFVANVLNPPPRNFTSEKSKSELSRKRMIRSVTEGRPGTAMMPWKNNLSDQEIASVVTFIRQKLMGVEP